MTISTSTAHVVSEQPDLTDVSLDALPTVDTADAAAVVDRAVGNPERDRQEQDVRSEQPDLTGVSLAALPTVDTSEAAAVVDRAVGSPERDRQDQRA